MMFRLVGNLPLQDIWVACSGGPDSMCVLDFLKSHPKRKLKVAFFHHGTEASTEAYAFVSDYAARNNLPFSMKRLTTEKPVEISPEEHWRNERYAFLHSLPGTVVLGHHLDDVIETYIFSMLNGAKRLIPYRNKNCIRPFLYSRKQHLLDWCNDKGVPHLHDKSNDDVRYARNRIRRNIVPEALKINPGLHKVVTRLLEAKLAEDMPLTEEALVYPEQEYVL